MSSTRSLIAPTANPLLEQALADKLQRRSDAVGSLGELEPIAVRLGLMQNTLKPRFHDAQVFVFAADHGLVVDSAAMPQRRPTHELVAQLLGGQLPLAAFARHEQLELHVVDCGVAADMPAHERLLMRKIAHGTRNARVGNAMTQAQAHAAMRAGMEIGESMRGNVVVCAGLGFGAHPSAAMVLARLTDTPVRDLLVSGPQMNPDLLAHLLGVTEAALQRHHDARDPVEVLAAFGGFEVAVMAGVMLVAASKRHLLLVDGIAACAALMVAARIAPPVTDYCVFCRSRSHRGIDQALNLFQATALLELGLESVDGTGATLAWPLVRCAATLLSEVADGEDPGPSRPQGLDGLATATVDP
jgi:nicotinate-nucleotide--dimethylbenzimidazole phosphoribosyltransferase